MKNGSNNKKGLFYLHLRWQAAIMCIYKKQTWNTVKLFNHVSGPFSGEWLYLVPRWHSGSHLVPRWLCLGGICQRAETLVLWDQPGKPDHLWYLDSWWPAGNTPRFHLITLHFFVNLQIREFISPHLECGNLFWARAFFLGCYAVISSCVFFIV